jgi:hypothetical protein
VQAYQDQYANSEAAKSMQGTTDFHHSITDARLPQAQPVFDDVFLPAPIIAPATLSDVGYGLISQWLCDAARFSTPPQDNGILGVADDVIEAFLPL